MMEDLNVRRRSSFKPVRFNDSGEPDEYQPRGRKKLKFNTTASLEQLTEEKESKFSNQKIPKVTFQPPEDKPKVSPLTSLLKKQIRRSSFLPERFPFPDAQHLATSSQKKRLQNSKSEKISPYSAALISEKRKSRFLPTRTPLEPQKLSAEKKQKPKVRKQLWACTNVGQKVSVNRVSLAPAAFLKPTKMKRRSLLNPTIVPTEPPKPSLASEIVGASTKPNWTVATQTETVEVTNCEVGTQYSPPSTKSVNDSSIEMKEDIELTPVNSKRKIVNKMESPKSVNDSLSLFEMQEEMLITPAVSKKKIINKMESPILKNIFHRLDVIERFLFNKENQSPKSNVKECLRKKALINNTPIPNVHVGTVTSYRQLAKKYPFLGTPSNFIQNSPAQNGNQDPNLSRKLFKQINNL